MTVRRNLSAALACAVLLLGASCGGNDVGPVGVETDDPVYQQGKQLQRQGRNPEALAAFLKIIEKRGERFAPESHFEAGQIYLQYIKDPVEAIHHFRKYLELQPGSTQAPLVRGLIDTAKREFLRTLPAQPDEEQSRWLDSRAQLERLQRENDQLKAEISTMRGGVPVAPMRVTVSSVDPNAASPTAPPVVVDESPISAAPLPTTPTPILQQSTKPPPNKTSGKQTVATGRKHTVAPHETLFAIAKKYGVKMEDIVAANPQALPSVNSPLRAGAELKIP